MRIAVAGIAHETNTFSPIDTDLARFESYGIVRGAEIVAQHVDAHTSVAGFLAMSGDPDVDVVPLMYAWANPAGRITAGAFDTLVTELLHGLRSGGPWDAVLLAQHGAAVADGFMDADGEIVARVRALIGPAVPIGVALDMHANISPRLVEAATIVAGYRTNPHVDARARAEEIARLVVSAARRQIAPTTALEQIPAVINVMRQATAESPMREIMATATALLDTPGILSVTASEGYPFADVAQMGMSCLVISDGSPDLARTAAARLAARIWAARDDFRGSLPAPAEALAMAVRDARWPTLLLDAGDNIGGGSPGNSTVLLEAALEAGAEGLLVILHDPGAVAACVAAGVGATIHVQVGPSTEGMHGRPLPVHGTILNVGDGRYQEPTPTHGGFRFFDAGTSAVLDIGADNLIVLTTKLTMPTSLQQLISLGIEPQDRRIIVAKGVISPQAAYGPISKHVIVVDTPGVTSLDLGSLKYHNRRRPLYPFEAEATYPPGPLALADA